MNSERQVPAALQRFLAATGSDRLFAKLIRFSFVGAASGITYAVAVALLVSGLGVTPTTSSVLGYLIALPVSFLGHRTYTFRSRATIVPEFIRFTSVHLVNMFVSLAGMAWAVDFLGLSYWVGILAAITLVPIATYITTDLWVFVDKSAASDGAEADGMEHQGGERHKRKVSAMKALLRFPSLYNAAQILSGFSGSRKKLIAQYLDLEPGAKVLDIGCGPGHIFTYMPEGIDYHGFDIDEGYIAHAKAQHGARAAFHCRLFDLEVAKELAGADVVMFNGVLHHMSDDQVQQGLEAAWHALKPGGRIITLDGCYREGQNWIAKRLLDGDRGEYVRSQPAYEALMTQRFPQTKVDIREDLSPIPYTFIIMLGTKARD